LNLHVHGSLEPVAIQFSVALRGQAVGLGVALPVTRDGRNSTFTLPTLEAYEVLIIE
jgi:hypothetical protein